MKAETNDLSVITEQSKILEGRKFIDELGNVRKAVKIIYDEGVPHLTWNGYQPLGTICMYNLKICKLHWV